MQIRYARWLVVTFLVGTWWCNSAGAASVPEGTKCPICSRANADTDSYATKAGSTLVRGTANFLLGWTELIRQPAHEVKQGGNVLTGVAEGVSEGFKRTVGGAAEFLTFWTPKVHGSYLHYAHDCPICAGKTKTK